MHTLSNSLRPALLSVMTLALLFGCDKGDAKKDSKKDDDKKADAKKADDKEAEADAPPPEPEKPKGPMFTASVFGEDTSIPIVAFDLTAAELPGYTIQVPEGTKAEDKSPSGKKLLNLGVNYSITVSEGPFKIDDAKKTYGILDPDGKIADEAEDHIIYERSGTGGFLFQAGVTVGDKQFHCGTVASGSAFTRRVIDQSVASCKSLAAAEGAAPAGDAAAPPAE